MAAAPIRFRIEALQEDSHDGHCMIYGETLDNFASSLPIEFERWLEFTCPVQYTSFWFRLALRRAPNHGGVDCDIFVKRTDDHHVIVSGDFWICARTMMTGVVNANRTVRLPRLSRNHRRAQLTVLGFISNDILTRLGDRPILFQAALGIHGCHREVDIEGSRGRNYPPPLPSLPLQLKMLSKM